MVCVPPQGLSNIHTCSSCPNSSTFLFLFYFWQNTRTIFLWDHHLLSQYIGMAEHPYLWCIWAAYWSSLSFGLPLGNSKYLVRGSTYHDLTLLLVFNFLISALSHYMPLFSLYRMLKMNSILLYRFHQNSHDPCQLESKLRPWYQNQLGSKKDLTVS